MNLDRDQFEVIYRDQFLRKSANLKKTSFVGNFAIKILVFFYFFLFCYKLIFKKVDIVHSNPSLLLNAVVRDSFFIIISSIFKKKILVFLHGWDDDFANLLETRPFLRKLFVGVFNKAHAICVLSEDFKQKLKNWGIKSPIYNETTMVNDNLLSEFNLESSIQERLSEPFNILFLSRIEKAKGVLQSIDAVSILRSRHINARLIVAGNGTQLNEMKNYTIQNKLSGIDFIGFVDGDKKRKTFDSSYAFLFPTQHGEGMPICVLEAMAFGLPVITRFAGGLKDFFKNGEHGFITDSIDPKIFADFLEKIIRTPNLYKEISYHNYMFAQDQLLASKVSRRIESIYNKIIG